MQFFDHPVKGRTIGHLLLLTNSKRKKEKGTTAALSCHLFHKEIYSPTWAIVKRV
mgnify:CR=1 FL=1